MIYNEYVDFLVLKLIVDNNERCVFKSDYREIAVSGFDITKNKSTAIKIQAIPIDDDWEKIIESNPCVCYM